MSRGGAQRCSHQWLLFSAFPAACGGMLLQVRRFDNVKTMLRPPLLDPSVPDEQLAAWIDSHTMHVHQFLDKLDRVRPHNVFLLCLHTPCLSWLIHSNSDKGCCITCRSQKTERAA